MDHSLLAFVIVLSPVQAYIIRLLFATRTKTMEWTDKRARLLQEVLANMKIVKLMAWESSILQRLDGFRRNELKYIKKLMMTRSGNMAVSQSGEFAILQRLASRHILRNFGFVTEIQFRSSLQSYPLSLIPHWEES